jgi:predicted dehydrogenase
MSFAQKPVHMALIGAGNRGQGTFGAYALAHPHRARFVAVVEPDEAKRALFAERHRIPPEHARADMEAFFRKPPAGVDAVVIATVENLRLPPLRAAMEKGWHILVEKPLGTRAEEFLEIYDRAVGYGGIVAVFHPLRGTPGYATLKALVDSGRYGRIMAIQHSENISYDHMAHSYVRGHYSNERLSWILLAKSCHDLDLLAWLVGTPAEKVASFGSLKHFRPENAPAGAPARCLDGCPARDCPYHVEKVYGRDDVDPAYLRTIGIFRAEDRPCLRERLQQGPFGRCVFRCDNDVVDSQSVAVHFADGVDANFSLVAHNATDRRITKVSLTNGELHFDLLDKEIHAWRFEPRIAERIQYPAPAQGHAGGDRVLMDNFTEAILTGDREGLITPIRRSLEGHLLVFAAETSRKTDRIVFVREYEEEIRRRWQNPRGR